MVTRFSYDALNRVTAISVSSGTGSTSWTYNSMGRIASKTETTAGISRTSSDSYDSNGRLSTLTYPSGLVVAYRYNSQGQIAAISVNGAPVLTNIEYQPFGAPLSWSWGNGTAYTRRIDTDNRISSYPLGADTRSLTYDAAGRITSITDTQPVQSQSLIYDNLDRLISWVAPTTNQSYAYDANGNRTSLVIGATPSIYAYPANSNRLASITSTTTNLYGYDASGDITSQTNRSYQYAASGRLASITSGRGTTNFAINGLGQRLNKSSAGGTRVFLYDEAGHLLGKYNNTGTALTETIYLNDTPVAVMKSGVVYNIDSDQTDTPRLITNSANTAVWRWDADPFGSSAANPNPAGLGNFNYNLRFSGQFYDAKSGLHYNYFRDYDPSTGRYVEADPIGLNGGSWSVYGYVYGNPIRFIDEDGLMGHAPGTAPDIGPHNRWPPLPYSPNYGPQNCDNYYAPGTLLNKICSASGNSPTTDCARACLHDKLPKDSCGNTKTVNNASQPPGNWYYDVHPACWQVCRWPFGHD